MIKFIKWLWKSYWLGANYHIELFKKYPLFKNRGVYEKK